MPARTDQNTSPNRLGNRARYGSARRLVDEEVNPLHETEEDLSDADPDMPGHLGILGADLISLGELQLELLSVDARDAAKESLLPSIWAGLGLGFVIGCCPLALLGFSWWLTDVTSLSLAASSLIVAAGGLLIALVFFWLSWQGFRKSLFLLNRSRIELKSNMEWIKHILTRKHERRWPGVR